MDEISNFLKSLIPDGFDLQKFLYAALILCVGALVIGFLGRLIFGKKSVLNQSVSSAIGILFIYALTIVLHSQGIDLKLLMSPLPFVTLEGDYLHLYSFISSDYVVACGQLLTMIVLAFLVNLVNGWLPTGKKLVPWLFFRCLSVILAMLLHTVVSVLLNMFLPEGLLTWAPVILLGLLLLMLATGALKFLVGAVIGTVNPVIGLLYTFFFSTVIGKQLSKAILTTGLIFALVAGLNYIGITAIYIASSALIAYIPLLIVLLVLWYVIGHLL